MSNFMTHSTFSKLESLYKRYTEVQMLLSDPAIIAHKKNFCMLSHEFDQLKNIFFVFDEWKKIQEDIKITETILHDSDLRKIAQEELSNAKIRLDKIERQLQTLLLPKNKNDELNAFIEIRAGTGGNEAALFASDLFRMYCRYADIRCWQVDIMNISKGDHGGYKEVIAKVSGKGVYGRLKFESGGHRVQRIPITDSHKRVHTSTCAIAVTPELPEEEMPNIDLFDLRIDTFRSSGAGGQHVNKTDSAIRITHFPTGIVVECQDERSQHKNKAKALAVLSARIYAAEVEKRQQTMASTRRNLLGNGDRNNRNRTYNFPQKRVTDHRIHLSIYRLEDIMNGNLDMLIEPIIDEYHSDQWIALEEKS